MSRIAESNVQSLDSLFLSVETATHIALADPAAEAASIAEEADIELSAMDRAEDACESEPTADAPEALVLTCDSDLRLNWGDLHEWLARS
jgi:hypothetical protein